MRTSRVSLTALAFALAAVALPARADVSYQCTGIGEEERAAADSVPQTLRLIFAAPNGQYLGDVATTITSGGAEVLNVTCPGPWLLVNLPDGHYAITATFQRQTKKSSVTISGGRRQKQVFTFKP